MMSHSLLLEPRRNPDLGERSLTGEESGRGRSLMGWSLIRGRSLTRGWSLTREEFNEGEEPACWWLPRDLKGPVVDCFVSRFSS